MLSQSFPPLADASAKILVLGSMPGVASLNAQQYYAHPRNAFWPIICAILNDSDQLDAQLPGYQQRLALLTLRGVALWDVLQSCYREGSLDSAIQEDSIVANDFLGLFSKTPDLSAVFFNGAKAEHSFNKHVLPDIKEQFGHLNFARLPSTSPAHASIGAHEKLKQWQQIRDYL